MASAISEERAEHLRSALYAYLKDYIKIGLPEKTGDTAIDARRAFGAVLGFQRRQYASSWEGVQCPLISRYPEQFNGSLGNLAEHKLSAEILGSEPSGFSDTKVWQLLVMLWLGAGGHCQAPYRMLMKVFPETLQYTMSDPLQAHRVVHLVMRCLADQLGHDGQTVELMKVIGGDGLDKKSRMNDAHGEFQQLVTWHPLVPELTQACRAGDPMKVMKRHLGLKAELFRKEFCTALISSPDPVMEQLGLKHLVFGPGARNGVKAFCVIPPPSARCDKHKYYRDSVQTVLPQLQGYMQEYAGDGCGTLSIGDVEICSCYACNFAQMAEQLQLNLPIKVPAGFVPYDNGEVVRKYRASLPMLCPGDAILHQCPPKHALSSRLALARFWGFSKLSAWWDTHQKHAVEKREHKKRKFEHAIASATPQQDVKAARCSEDPIRASCSSSSSSSASERSDGGATHVSEERDAAIEPGEPSELGSHLVLSNASAPLAAVESCAGNSLCDPISHAIVSASSAGDTTDKFDKSAEVSTLLQGANDGNRPEAIQSNKAPQMPLREFSASGQLAMTPPWEKVRSRQDPDVYYYFNARSGESLLEPPRIWRRRESCRQAGVYYYFDCATGEVTPEPPLPWSMIQSRYQPGLFYYHNTATGETSLQKPDM